jgi:hypothetical protein
MNQVVEAIRSIRPNSEFVIHGGNLDNIEWHILEGEIPTKKEIEQAIKDLAAAELVKEQEKATAKNAILERIGLTAEEATILLS